MKAIVLHGPASIRFEPGWPDPAVPAKGALVRVKASGICGSDLPRIMTTGAYHHPMIPGHEFAGIVEACHTDKVKAGDRVAVLPIIPCRSCAGCALGPFHCERYDFVGSRRDGGFAEFCAVPEDTLFVLPDSISAEEGAFIEPLSVTLHILRRSRMRPGTRVLVFGGGAIGILTAQWARILGASEVVLADVRDESLAVARACGIETAVNPLSAGFQKIGEFESIFEAAGSGAALRDGIERATSKGSITIVGRDVSDTVLPVGTFEKLMRKELTLSGCWGYDNRDEEQFIYDCLDSGRFSLKPMITQRIPLEEGPEMIEKMWKKEVFYCKALFAIE